MIRPQKESKFSEKHQQLKKEMTEFIRNELFEHIIEAAFCYGESLGVCRAIQKRFENRPVTKYLFPMVNEFEFSLQGMQPKSLQSLNTLGQVMCLDA